MSLLDRLFKAKKKQVTRLASVGTGLSRRKNPEKSVSWKEYKKNYS